MLHHTAAVPAVDVDERGDHGHDRTRVDAHVHPAVVLLQTRDLYIHCQSWTMRHASRGESFAYVGDLQVKAGPKRREGLHGIGCAGQDVGVVLNVVGLDVFGVHVGDVLLDVELLHESVPKGLLLRGSDGVRHAVAAVRAGCGGRGEHDAAQAREKHSDVEELGQHGGSLVWRWEMISGKDLSNHLCLDSPHIYLCFNCWWFVSYRLLLRGSTDMIEQIPTRSVTVIPHAASHVNADAHLVVQNDRDWASDESEWHLVGSRRKKRLNEYPWSGSASRGLGDVALPHERGEDGY